MHHWASEFNNSIPSSATDGMSSQASYKHRVSQFVSKVESSITETTQEVSSPASCSKGGWTLKPVQVAQGSCQVFKTSKDWHFKASLGNLLSIPCSSDWKIFCLYPVGNSPFPVYGHCLFSHLPRSPEAAVKSPHSHLSHLQAVEGPLPWPLLTPTMVVPTGLAPVCQCLFSDRKALSLQLRCQPLMSGWLSTRSPGSFLHADRLPSQEVTSLSRWRGKSVPGTGLCICCFWNSWGFVQPITVACWGPSEWQPCPPKTYLPNVYISELRYTVPVQQAEFSKWKPFDMQIQKSI